MSLIKLKDFVAKIYQPFMVFSVIFIIVMQINNEFLRRSGIEEIRSFATVNQQMINARGEILVILLDADLEQRRLNTIEIDRIKTLWRLAELDRSDTR